MASRVFLECDDAKKHEKDDKDGNVYDYRKKHLPPRPINETRKLQADEENLQGTDERDAVIGVVATVAQNCSLKNTPESLHRREASGVHLLVAGAGLEPACHGL